MLDSDSQKFLQDLDKKLWSAADRLRANLDVAVYKHAVLGLIFLKYVSDSFAVRQKEIETQLRDKKSDYYIEKNVFWITLALKCNKPPVITCRAYFRSGKSLVLIDF